MSSKILHLFILCFFGFAVLSVAPSCDAQERQKVYYSNDPASGLDLYYQKNGLEMVWSNSGVGTKEASFTQWQLAEDISKIDFDLDVVANTNTTIKVDFLNHFGNHFDYTLSNAESAPGSRTVVIPLAAFTGPNTGPDAIGDDVDTFTVSVSGSDAQIDATITNFNVETNHALTYHLFDADVWPNLFPPSRLYPGPQPMLVDNQTPRVFVAEGANWLAPKDVLAGIATIGNQFPGAFGVDMSGWASPENKASVQYLNSRGIKTITEEDLGFPQFSAYFEIHDDYLTNSDGIYAPNLPGNYPFPYHGEDITTPDVAHATEDEVDEAAQEGFPEMLIIDYTWPWNGRWGYGPRTVAAFDADLSGTDSGMYFLDTDGIYAKQGFWNYLKLYTDVPFAPGDLGLSSWGEFKPVTEAQASHGGLQQKKNLFLFDALWHYEYLKFFQKIADYGHSKALTVFPSLNPEDPFNGTDLYAFALLRNVDKLGYEYFGSPSGTIYWYHDMRYYAENLQRQGKNFSLIEELNDGGHGASKFNWDAAYAFHYDVTNAAKPIDYNNQYLEAVWPNVDKSDKYQFPRYAHWAAGALAFLQSRSESPNLQRAKATVLIASRGVLEYQPGLANSMAQTGNIGGLLDQLHIPFDEAGKEQLAQNISNARTVIYCPAESSPMHFTAVRDWLDTGSGKVLISHSFVPFSFSNGTIDLHPGLASDLTWAGKPNWNDYQTAPVLSVNQKLGLSLKNIVSGAHIDVVLNGQRYDAVRDVYELAPTASADVLLQSSDGIPLITRINHGANSILYINVRPLPTDLTSNTDFDRQLLLKAVTMAGLIPEATADDGITVHLYDVPGGRTAVLWDVNALAGQDARHFYSRDPRSQPDNVTVNVRPNTPYTLYHFFDDKTENITSAADGILTLPMANTVELYYYGKTSDPDFQAVLARVKKTRSDLRAYEPDPIPIAAVPFSSASQGASAGSRFVVFSGGMVSYNRGKTAGTSLTIKYRLTENSPWITLGTRNFKDVYYGEDTNLYALPLGNIHPVQLAAIITMNDNPAYDSTYIADFGIRTADGTHVVDFTTPEETGLVHGITYDSDQANLKASGAGFAFDQANEHWVMHPAYNGGTAPVYAIFTLQSQ